MRQNKLIIIVLLIIIVMLVIAIREDITSVPKHISTPAIQTRNYTDPGKYFTMKIPSTWQTTSNVATNTTGLKTNHPVSQKIEIVTHMANGVGVVVQVFEGTQTCNPSLKPNAEIAGLPANYNPVHRSYTIQTNTATYVLYSFYPGSSNLHVPPRFHVTLTQQQQAAYDQQLQSVLKTFKPLSATPLSC